MRDLVSKRASHCQAGHILGLEPDPEWAERIVILISVTVDSPVVVNNSLRLQVVVWLVVSGQSLALASSGRRLWGHGLNGTNDNAAGVAHVCHV